MLVNYNITVLTIITSSWCSHRDIASGASGVSNLLRIDDPSCHVSFKGTLDGIRDLDDNTFDVLIESAKPLVLGCNHGYGNALLLLIDKMRVPNADGTTSAFMLRFRSDILDKEKYKLAVLKHPNNDISIMLQKPIEQASEIDEMASYLAEMELSTE